LKEFYTLVRGMSAQAEREIQSARDAALKERKTVYIPLQHPEAP
jgi:hypothetical protein